MGDIVRLRRAFLGGGAQLTVLRGVRGPNFIKRGGNIGRSSLRCIFVSEFGYFAAFSIVGSSKLSDFENDGHPLPCAAAQRGVLIKKKEKKRKLMGKT